MQQQIEQTTQRITPAEAALAASLRDAAERGDSHAQYMLARRLLDGRGAEKDPFQAARYMERAAESGITGAVYMMGVMRFSGIGVARDLVQAYRLFARAAELKYPGAEESRAMVGRWLDEAERQHARAGRRLAA